MHNAVALLVRFVLFCSLALLFVGCGGKGGSSSSPQPPAPPTLDAPAAACGSASCNVLISWWPSRESHVNSTGGGYRVYHSTTANFNITDPGVTTVNVPYQSGFASAPVSVELDLASGTHYIKVVAYSAFPVANSTSGVSAQQVISVP